MSAVTRDDVTDVRDLLLDERMQTRASGEPLLPHFLGEVVQIDLGAGGQGARALDGVLQFPDVAGPHVTTQRVERARAIAHDRAAHSLGRLRQEVLQEGVQFIGTLAEWRNTKVDDTEPVVEVRAETMFAHLRRQISIGGRDDTHVDRARSGLPYPSHLALLQDAEQLHLHRRRHLADLVEEQRAAVRRFEHPGAVAHRTGEGAARMAKEFALQQAVGERAAVDAHEGAAGTTGSPMHPSREPFLADTTLSGNQQRRVHRRDTLGQGPDAGHRAGSPPTGHAVVSRGRQIGERRLGGCVRRAGPVMEHGHRS